jgi:membrane fusion protein (multidrug efflux system)
VRIVLLGFPPIAALFVGIYFYATGGRYVSTENAYVKSDKVAISTDVSGRVANIEVTDNQIVKAGTLLFQLDPEPFRIVLDEAEATLGATKDEIEATRALYRQKHQDLTKADIDIAFLGHEVERQKQLIQQGNTTHAKFDDADHNMKVAQQSANVAREQIAEVVATLAGNPNIRAEQHPNYLQAKSRRDDAALDLRRISVFAPMDGEVTRVTLQPGEHVEKGRPIFSLVKTTSMWVEANMKETELGFVRVGQPARITVDTYPGYAWNAKVESISPATGAEFSLLPPQNATGNWVKVVQRVAVKLLIEPHVDAPRLRAGMSVFVEIDTAHAREMLSLVR